MKINIRKLLKTVLLAIALLGAFFLWVGESWAQSLDEVRYQRALDQIRAGQYLEAAETYKMILETSTDREFRAKVQELLGDLYALYLDLPDLAVEAYETEIRDYPDLGWVVDATFNIGMIHFEKGNWQEARDKFREVLRLDPHSARAFTAQTLLEKAEEYLLNPESAPEPAPTPDLTDVASRQIRVLVVDFSTDLTIASNTPIKVGEQRGGSEECGRNVRVYTTGGQLYVAEKPTSGSYVTLSCSDQSLMVADRRFRGELRAVKKDRGFFIVNHLPLEDYLRGVIPREMPASWSIEALKAQAVAARTYALFQINKHRDEEWDVMATVMSQVYGGRDAETPSTDRAVRETAGQILAFNDRPILAYFHASSGGHTESTEDVWGTPLPYLEAVPDPYSNGNPTDNWEASFTQDQVNQALASEGISGVTDIAPAAYSPTGRVTRIRFQTASDAKVMPANTTRLRLGSTVMKSTWWEVSRIGEKWYFQGKGYGHGVGMSQWGAKGLASEGKDYLEILQIYYPLCQVSGG